MERILFYGITNWILKRRLPVTKNESAINSMWISIRKMNEFQKGRCLWST